MAQLQVRQRGEVLRVLPLEMRHLSIGRTPDNGLPLRDTSVAVRHAEITEEGGVLLLTALAGDQALTYVNGQRLPAHQPHRLEHGDEVQIGPFTVAYLTEAQVSQPPEASRPLVTQGELGAQPAHPPFPTYPAPLPGRHAPSLYTQFLPPLFQESEFLSRYLKIFEVIWEPLQVRQDHLESHFDARLAPPQMLPWMAQWLGVPLDAHWPEARQRAWMREAVSLYRWRGTRYGLTRALETVYGLSPVLEEDPSRPHTLDVRLLDSLDGPDTASREAITRFIHQHAPAHTRVTVTFVDAPEPLGADPAAPSAGTPA